MKTLVLSLAIIAYGALATIRCSAQDAPRDGVFIHISHGAEDPHRLLMALSMATLMAADPDVLVYFDIEAVNAVFKDSARRQEQVLFLYAGEDPDIGLLSNDASRIGSPGGLSFAHQAQPAVQPVRFGCHSAIAR